MTAIHNDDELSLQHETSINEGSIDMSEEHCSATSWAICFEKLLNDELGLQVFTEFLTKEFSQENIQFWVECENFKKLTNNSEVNTLSAQKFKKASFSFSDSRKSKSDLVDVFTRYGRWIVSDQYR